MPNRPGIVKLGDSVPVPDLRIGQQGEMQVSQIHAPLYEQSVRRNLFFSHCIARATSLPATAAIGHILWNPPDSGVNLVLTKWSSMISVTSATCTGILLCSGYQSTEPTTVTAADRIGSTFLAHSGATNQLLTTGKVRAYAIATLLQVPLVVWLLHHNTAAIATTGVDKLSDDFNGAFVAPPGGLLCVAAQGAATAAAAHTSSFMWEEVPVL